MAARNELDDIAALVRTGFGDLGGAAYLLLRIADPARARAWLAGQRVASAADLAAGHLDQALQIAFTARGLAALGIEGERIETFAPEFLDGIAGDERRSSRLGDIGANAPARWQWGSGAREPDVMLLLFARAGTIEAWSDSIADAAAQHGLERIERLLSIVPDKPDGPRREPFGFADGVSQPQLDWDGTVAAKGAANRNYRNRIAAGEVLLGHGNEYGFVPDFPEVSGLGRNGTYLVFRQISQDVDGFWRAMAAQAGAEGAVQLAERCIGRGLDGAPLAGLGAGDEEDFTFAGDPDGRICPIGAHIRRANPRSGDDPHGDRGTVANLLATLGFKGSPREDAVAPARFHRILRRGRPYGALRTAHEALSGAASPEPSGLYFICLNASLVRQFEFVQSAWLMSPAFAGLGGEQDLVVGHREPFPAGCPVDSFRYHDASGEPRLWPAVPRFARVEGGAYFFLPGMTGLRRILQG
jgi:deferrochelatase/peroxidase EfeB